MKRIQALFALLALFIICSGAHAQVSRMVVHNASSTGTSTNKLTKLTGAPSTAVVAAITDTSGIIGVTVAGAGTTLNATIQLTGLTPCVFDGATTAGHYVQNSATVAGDCHDAGASYPASGQIIGRVLTTNASGGTYNVDLFTSSEVTVATSSCGTLPTTPNSVTFDCTSTPSGGVGGTPNWSAPGLVVRTVSGSSDTIAAGDCNPKGVVYTGSANTAVTLPTATTLGIANCIFQASNTAPNNAVATITATTWVFNTPSGYTSSTLPIYPGQTATIKPDPNGTSWDYSIFGTGSSAGAALAQSLYHIHLEANFCGGNTIENVLGNGWAVDSGSGASVLRDFVSDSNHPCSMGFKSTATGGQSGTFWTLCASGSTLWSTVSCPGTQDSGTFGNLAATTFDSYFVVKLPSTITNLTIWFGYLMSDAAGDYDGNLGIHYDTTGNAGGQPTGTCTTCQTQLTASACVVGGTCTQTGLGAPVAGDWVVARMRGDGAGNVFFSLCQSANGGCILGSETQISTNIDTSGNTPALYNVTQSSSTKEAQFDRFIWDQMVNP